MSGCFSIAESENRSLKTDPGATVEPDAPPLAFNCGPPSPRRAPSPPPWPFLPSGPGLAEHSQTFPVDGSIVQPMAPLLCTGPTFPVPVFSVFGRAMQVTTPPDSRRLAVPHHLQLVGSWRATIDLNPQHGFHSGVFVASGTTVALAD